MASSAAIKAGAAFVELFGDNSALMRTLRQSERAVTDFGRNVSSMGLKAAGIGVTILTPITAAAKAFADAGSAINDMSLKSGVGTTALQTLGYAAQQNGASMDALAVGLKKMQKNVFEAANGSKEAKAAFGGLGLSADELMKKSPDEQFRVIADAIAKIANPAARTAAAMDIFGKSGTELLAMMSDGRAGIEGLERRFQALGLTMSHEDVAAADQLGDTLDDLFATGRRIVQLVGGAIAPTLQTFAMNGRPYREAERDVQSRLVEIAALERTLRTWRVKDKDLAEIHAEADRLAKADELSETRMPDDDIYDWARVEVRAPRSGVILEKNIAIGDIVDTDTNLFMIGDLSQLVVWAHVYEEDLPLLEALPRPIPWTVTLPSRPGELFSGTLEKIGAVIDPAQHTALVTGRVENAAADLKIGQFVIVNVLLPPPKDELEVPATAVVEDGRVSVVFIQPDPQKNQYIRRQVSVVRRFRDMVYHPPREARLMQPPYPSVLRRDAWETSSRREMQRDNLILRHRLSAPAPRQSTGNKGNDELRSSSKFEGVIWQVEWPRRGPRLNR